jgi:hypothetical protein
LIAGSFRKKTEHRGVSGLWLCVADRVLDVSDAAS